VHQDIGARLEVKRASHRYIDVVGEHAGAMELLTLGVHQVDPVAALAGRRHQPIEAIGILGIFQVHAIASGFASIDIIPCCLAGKVHRGKRIARKIQHLQVME